MERKELLSSLYALKEKMTRCVTLKKKIQTLEDKVKQNDSSRDSLTRPDKLSNDVPHLRGCYSYFMNCTNLKKFDDENKPKEVISEKKANVLATVTVFLLHMIGVAICYLIIGDEFVVKTYIGESIKWMILLCLFWLVIGQLLRNMYLDIGIGIEMKREDKYVRNYARQRKEAYQKDYDANQAELDAYFDKVRSFNEDTEECNKFIALAEKQLKEAVEVVNADDCIPAAYKEINIVDTIVGYLENLRADSLKEAINLYEYEHEMKAHNASVRQAAWQSAFQAERQADAMREAAEHQERLTQEAERRRRAAEKAAEANQEALDILKDWERKSN